jgi:hypothetical protein
MNRVTIKIVEVFVVNTPAYVGFFAGFILIMSIWKNSRDSLAAATGLPPLGKRLA